MNDRNRQTRRQMLKYGLASGMSTALAGCGSKPNEVGLIRDRTVTDAETVSADETFDQVQQAVTAATPGDTITVPPGRYRERVSTVQSGSESEPITITGPESAVLCGARGEYGVLWIQHSHIHLTGLSIEGLLSPNQPYELSSYVDGQLVQTRPLTSTDEYLRGIVIAPHSIGYSRQSLVGLERTASAEIGPCRITGLAGANYLVGDAESRNGELFYIGTSYSNLGSEWHPWTDFDRTRNIRIHHIDNSDGHPHAIAVDMKEGTRNITVEYLTDRNAGYVTTERTPGSISFKSHDSTVRWCDIGDSPVGVEFAPALSDQQVYGNDLYGCKIRGFDTEPIVVTSSATSLEQQGTLCGNLIDGFIEPRPNSCPETVPQSDTIGYTNIGRSGVEK